LLLNYSQKKVNSYLSKIRCPSPGKLLDFSVLKMEYSSFHSPAEHGESFKKKIIHLTLLVAGI
jgi:hypothetical protein